MIVDTHTFIGKMNRLGIQVDSTPYFSFPQFREQKFLTVLIDNYRDEKGVSKIQGDSRFLGAYLFFNPNSKDIGYDADRDSPKVIRRLAKMTGVVGLKSLPSVFKTRIDNESYFPFYEIAQENGLPVLLHCASSGKDSDSAEMVRKVCDQFPNLKVILAHFGGGKKEYREAAVELAKENTNVFLNTTSMDPLRIKRKIVNGGHRTNVDTGETREEVLDTFKKAIGEIPRQILAGSDLGYYPPEEYTL